MPRPTKPILVHLREPEGGHDPQRLAAALSMLLSKEDLLEFFAQLERSGQQTPEAAPEQKQFPPVHSPCPDPAKSSSETS